MCALVSLSALCGTPTAAAIEPPSIDPGAVPPDGPPTPPEEMRQGAYCTRVATMPDTDYRVQPKYMDMLNLPEAWQFGRGAGVSVAVIDTGVSPHPRLPNLIGGGDFVVDGGDGLSDCDAHGTWVASLIAAEPADGKTPLPPPRETRRPDTGAHHRSAASAAATAGADDDHPAGPRTRSAATTAARAGSGRLPRRCGRAGGAAGQHRGEAGPTRGYRRRAARTTTGAAGGETFRPPTGSPGWHPMSR